jgi:PAS domain S-box-containing protein
MVDVLPISVFRKDLESRLTFGNKAFELDMGRSMSDLYGKNDAELFPPELSAKYRADDLRVIETGENFHDVERHVDGNGELQFVEVLKSPVFDSERGSSEPSARTGMSPNARTWRSRCASRSRPRSPRIRRRASSSPT